MTIDEYNRLLQKQNRGKSAASEHDLQVACVNWFRLSYREYADLLIAIPNGGYRAKSTARYMKAEGQKAGVPDLLLAVPRGDFHGLWIEMKNGKAGRVSDNQTEMMNRLRQEGYKCDVCRSFDEFYPLAEFFYIAYLTFPMGLWFIKLKYCAKVSAAIFDFILVKKPLVCFA